MKNVRRKLIVLLMVLLCATSAFGFRSVPISRMTNAVQAYPPGTATGQTLQAAYDYLTDSDRDAAMGTLGVLNQRTLVLTAGAYTSTALVLDTSYVNIVGLGDVTITDISGTAIDCGSIIAKVSNVRIDATSIPLALTNDENVVLDNVQMTDGTNFVDVAVGVYTTSKVVTSAEILAINATPKVLVAAEGAGIAVEIVSAVLFLDYNSAAYANNGILGIYETDATGTVVSDVIPLADFLDETADTYQVVQALSANTALNDNVPLVLTQATGESITGDSPVTIDVTYRVHNFN